MTIFAYNPQPANELDFTLNKPAPSKQKRWTQFSLRFLLLAMLASGVVLGFLTYSASRAKKDFEVEQELQKFDGFVCYDYEFDENWNFIQHAEPPGPEWTKRLFGENLFARIVVVGISPGPSLKSTNWISKLTALRHFTLNECPALENADHLQHTHELKSVQFAHCENLRDIDGLSSHFNLDVLALSANASIDSIEGIRGADKLTELCIDRCPNLVDLSSISTLTSLEKLSLDSESPLILQYITNLKELKSLSIRLPPDTQSLKKLTTLTKLEHLQILNCPNLKKLILPPLPRLRTLTIYNADSLTDLKGFENLGMLSHVNLHHCDSLTNLNGLSEAPKLEVVHATSCKSLKDVSALSKTKSLYSLTLGKNFSKKEIDQMQNQLSNVKVLGGPSNQ